MTTLVPVETLSNGDLEIDLLPTRGLDIGAARWRGERFSWESPLGHIPWQGDFARSFGGGLMVTCGLRNAGAPSEGQPQHGWYSSLPARDVKVGGDRATARIVDADVPGPTLELTRAVEVSASGVRVTDTVANLGPDAEPAPVLMHVNLLWDELDIDSTDVTPRDDDAAAGDWRTVGPPGPERVYEHHGATRAVVRHGSTRVTVRSDLPRLWEWIHPAYGALGIEPANCSVLGRAHDRREGALPMLEPGARRTTTLEITVEDA